MLEKITHEYYESVDSTNDRLKVRAREGEAQGLVISAGYQSAGKGRTGRKWQSPTGDSISTSMLIRPEEVPIEAVPTITILAAMAVRDALKKTCGLDGKIKWPNDIVVGGKKICGILTEMELKGSSVDFVICGIGVNVHNKEFSEDIAFKATSVDAELEKIHSMAADEGAQVEKSKFDENNSPDRGSRKQITYAIWESFRDYYNQFIQTYDLTNLKEEYEAHLANKGNRVRIEDPRGAYEAVAVGINNKGALIVDVDGQRREIESGEVSVRGLYGYV